MSQGRALGQGLIILGAVVAALVILWLLVTFRAGQLRSGGFVLGLIILSVLALPPIGVGYYLFRRSAQEQVDAASFERRRRVLEADRLLRATLADDLRQQERRLNTLTQRPAEVVRAMARLRDMADDLEPADQNEASWYEAVEVSEQDVAQVRSYDDLLSDGLRRIDGLIDDVERDQEGAVSELLRAIQQWEQSLQQRQDLLLRGRRAAAVAPGELLRGRLSATTASSTALVPGDAVSYEEHDYLVEVSVTYFGGGRTWWLHRLRSTEDERWLYVAPGGVTLAVLGAIDPPGDPRSEMIRYKGSACRPAEQGDATATIQSGDERQEALAVHYWRFTCPDGSIILVEHWSNEPRAYVGKPIKPSDLEVWSAQRSSEC